MKKCTLIPIVLLLAVGCREAPQPLYLLSSTTSTNLVRLPSEDPQFIADTNGVLRVNPERREGLPVNNVVETAVIGYERGGARVEVFRVERLVHQLVAPMPVPAPVQPAK